MPKIRRRNDKQQEQSIRVYTVCPDLSVWKLRIITVVWAASSEFGTYRICEQRRFSQACASAQSRQNLRCSLIQAMSQEEPSDRKPDPWPLWMAGHAQLKFVMMECLKTLDASHIKIKNLLQKSYNEPRQAKMCLREFATRWHSNQPAQLKRLARILKFRI